MFPEFWTIPILNYTVKSYGLMLMIGFLSAIYLAAKRAEKVRANPDLVINIGFFALIGGVVGARLFFVIHYWDQQFAGRSNPIMAVLDVSQGGMEFLGGVIGAFVLLVPYILKKKRDPNTELMRRDSLRLYLDILAPGLMWGLAFGRIGCLLNGCCWGGICEGTIAQNWGVTFPYGSPAYIRQFQNRQVKVPAPLIFVRSDGQAVPLSRLQINKSIKDRNKAQRAEADARMEYDYLVKMDPNSPETKDAKLRWEKKKKAADLEAKEHTEINYNLKSYPSLEFPGQTMTPSELSDLAAKHRSRKVHPTQLYASINALLAAVFLAWVFRIRRRHGVVFAVFLLTYPWTRIVLELIRVDNPKDAFGLTISQFVGLAMFLSGVALYLVLRKLPLRSPAAVVWEPPPEESEK